MKHLVILTRGLSHTLLRLIAAYHEHAEFAFDFSPESTQLSAFAATGNKARVICGNNAGLPFSHAVRVALSLLPCQYHTIYVHGVDKNALFHALLGAKIAGTPQVIACAHSTNEPVTYLPSWCFRKATASNERLNKLMFNGHASILPDGIILGHCFDKQLREAYRAALGFIEHHVYLQISPFLKEGQYDLTLNLFHRILELDNNARLICVGQGPMRNEILARVEYENLSDFVILPGDTDNVSPLLMAADALLIPGQGSQGAALIPAAQAAGLLCLVGEKTDCSSALVEEGIYPLQTVLDHEFQNNLEMRRNLSKLAIEKAEKTCRTASAIGRLLAELASN